MAHNRISVLVALEGADDGLRRALNSAQQSLGDLAADAKTAGEKATAGLAEVRAGMSAFGTGRWLGANMNGTEIPLVLDVWVWSCALALVAWTLVQRHGKD